MYTVNYIDGIQRFVDNFEKHIEEDIDIDEAIAEIHISKFHFYRLFKEVVGLSVYDYIKKRRLTRAAEHIKQSQDDMLTIAIKYGFSSQEVFTRNFKKMFGITPGRLRKEPHFKISNPLKPINANSIFLEVKALNGKVRIEERIETLSIKLIGISRYSHDENVSTITPFINSFLQQVDRIANRRNDVLYRVCYDVDQTNEIHTYQELVAVEVADFTVVPEGMITKEIDSAKVVTFTHKGRLFQDEEGRVLNTYHFICYHRIPVLDGKLTNELVIERYGTEFLGPNDDNSKMDISFSIT
ncbi:AraC family transcriptional regulator [Aquibacillus rhizosphaerae]|uniref:AraC family transcriptional regulator n=1 Tax=Aquibacillus rhizosphaerae TaxID=3051431 RepID=A0ABT7L994_9BACI|nr:AraC family transcriptional regulator [Aquibacillus sp. LR5S19]MDL4842433.1 AraC family transcriptional regulator [Aquibacillus sp. LR5S19]